MESQSTPVLTNSSQQDLTELLLKRELEREQETLEFSTLIGLLKMELTSSTKSSSSTHTTRPLEEIQESTGLLPENTSTENQEDSHQLERDTEVLELEEPEITITDHLKNNHGSEEIKSL